MLNGKGWFFLNEGQFKKAIESWRILLEDYSNFLESYLSIVEAQIKLDQNTAPAKEAFLRSKAKPQIYSDKEKKEFLEQMQSYE